MIYKSLASVGVLLLILGLAEFLFWKENSNDRPEPEIQQQILLYYYDAERDRDPDGNILCSNKGLVEIERSISPSENNIEKAIQLLISDKINDADSAHGLSSEFPLDGFILTDTALIDGSLLLTFEDPLHKTSGGSCRVNIMWQQIEATAKQFAEVRQVTFTPTELFQP